MSKPKEVEAAIVRDLVPAEHNPRTITDARSQQLAKSMGKFGDLSGIVFNRRTGRLVCGHQRIKHLQANAKIRKQPASDDCGTVAIGAIVSGARASWLPVRSRALRVPDRRRRLGPLSVSSPRSWKGRRAGQQVTRGIHTHTCVSKTCRRQYKCVNDCDPKHLRDSLCAACFKAAQEA